MQYHTIQKPDVDDRQYKYFKLVNDLQCVVISHPTADRCAAALDVHVGHFSDPKEVAGLAHFCEHMLFLGTEKYPDEGSYQAFVKHSGGRTNAYTSTENTNYYFDIVPDHFKEGLDRFAQFFIAPLFTADATSREMKAVNSEHNKNIQEDTRRKHHFMKLISNPEHPYHKFGTGNLETLDEIPKQNSIDIREALLSFHDKHYSSNTMTLAILGKESVETLESWVQEMFSPIVNKHLEPKTSAKSPYPQLLLEHQLQKFYKIVPVRNLRDVTVVFPIPVTDDEKAYLTKSNRYWSHLIGHESEGSIFYSLKKKGWVNSLSSGQMSKFTGSFIFGVTISLTEEGEDHVEECIVALFQYLEYMRRMGPQKWIYDECKDLASVKFKYLEKTTPSDYVSGLASSLQKHRPEHIISGSYLWFDYDQEDIADFLKHMVPENMVILYQSQRFAGKTDQKERWYGIEYIKEDINSSLLEKLSQIKLVDAELHLPVENPFIPRDLSLIKEEANNVTQHPIQIVEDQWCSVWYKKDEEFTQPRVNVYYKFIVAWTQTSPHYTIMSKLYNKMLLDNLNETLYFADLSDFEYHIQQNDTGFTVRLSGWNDKMSKMNTILFQRMVDASSIIRQDRFQILKERMIQNLKNKEKDQPYQHAMEEVSYVQVQNTFQNKELLEALQQCSFEHMTQYGRIWLNTLHFTLLIHGNYSLADAHSLVTETKKLFVLATTPVEPEKRIIKLESGKRYIRQITEPNAENKNSALEVLYRVGLRSPRTEALIDLLAQIMSNAFFNTLRTKEQIGYIVFCRVRHDHNVVSLGLLLQSSEKDPIYMLERCDVFVQNYFETIKNLEESEFEKNVKSLIAKKLEKDKNLTQQTTHLFKEIVTKQYKFDRKEELVTEIEKLTRNDLIEFYQQNFLSDKTNQLIIEVFASGHEEFDKLRKEDENIVYIDNVHSFKHSMPMYPAFIKY